MRSLDDENVPLAHAEFVVRTVPNAELFALDECGHLIWVGPAADQAHQKVLAFLNRHVPQRRPNEDGGEPRCQTAEGTAAGKAGLRASVLPESATRRA